MALIDYPALFLIFASVFQKYIDILPIEWTKIDKIKADFSGEIRNINHFIVG
jgi:hypothetical protein